MTPKQLKTNMDVDFVIKYKISNDDKQKASERFQILVRTLADINLDTEVRAGDDTSLLIFVKARNDESFANVVFRSRIKDWLHGVRQIQPIQETVDTLTQTPLSEAERQRMIYSMITSTREDGGAGITPGHGDWKNVEAVVPLHDHERNKKWLTDFSSKTFLTPQDLDNVRDCVGEKIAYYYAFLQTYFQFLIFPAAFGFSIWALIGNFSAFYMVVNGFWCITFVEYWKRQEYELSIRWGVKNVGSIESRRREFRPDETRIDQITGEKVPYFSSTKRLQRQLLQIPLAVVSVIALGLVICTCYAIEIFLSEIYSGPFKSILVYTPTILLIVFVPTVSSFLTKYAEQLTTFENYETQEAHDRAMVSKLFVINFITSYLAIFLTSFVYVPFAKLLVPYLDVFSLIARPIAENVNQTLSPPPAQFTINPQRLPNQMFYFAVTAPIVSFLTETIVPLVQRKGESKLKATLKGEFSKSGGIHPSISANDHPDEKAFLNRVREELSLPEYDVTTDLREMVVQFGYLSLFSVVWALTPVAYLINNWIELRGDLFKLVIECRRPHPERADSIGPWMESMEFLAWLGSITSAALVYMFSDGGLGPDGRPSAINIGLLFITVFLSEHTFLVVRLAVRTVISKLDSENMQKERSERFMVRRQFLENAGLGDAVKPLARPADSPLNAKMESTNINGIEDLGITRQSLEEDARHESLHDSSESSRFWDRQRGWKETERVGLRLIDMMESGEKKTN